MKTQTQCLVESILAGSPSRAFARRRVAEMALGIVEAIRRGRVPVPEAAEGLFTLDNYLAIRRHRLGAALVELFQWGMELEDVVEIVPGPRALDESLRSIVEIAHGVLATPAIRFKRPRRTRAHLRASTRSRVA